MATHHYIVAQHAFAVNIPDGDTGIAMPSYEPFAVEADDARELLFTPTVDDAFYPSENGELIGEFDCGAA